MAINKFNSEGYIDLTTYAALTNIELEEKAERKSAFKPLVYICSPFSGDVERNVAKAQGYSRFAISKGCIHFAPHLLFPQFLDDMDKEQREIGLFCGMVLLCKCREIWVFGKNVTKGMAREIEKAKQKAIPIKYFNDKCEEVSI